MGATTMEFREENGPVVSVRVPRVSAFHITGELKDRWQHRVPYRTSDMVNGDEVPRDRRVAIILRNVQGAMDAEPDAQPRDANGQA